MGYKGLELGYIAYHSNTQRSLKVETIVHPLMVSPWIGVTDVRKLGGPGGSLPLGSSTPMLGRIGSYFCNF